jgi:hypothetical protein
MSAQTISAILERVETVLAAAPLNLELARQPFSSEGVPNSLVDTTCRVTSGGMVHSRSTSNYQALRIDRITVTVGKTMNFDGYESQRALQDLLDEIERAIIADGPEHGYMVSVEKGSRKITQKKDSDVYEASINFLADYDFNEA